MKAHRPWGAAPTTLEAEILKLRAFEMMLVLFYVEDLKKFILESFEASHRIDSEFPVLPKSGKLRFAHDLLVADGVMSELDSRLFLKLIDYRNVIGHELHALTCDVGAYAELGDYEPGALKTVVKYDYSAAKEAARLSANVRQAMSREYVSVISFRGLRFETAEKVYLSEIKRLKSNVNRAVEKHNNLVEQARISLEGCSKVVKVAQPGHPRNLKNNGSLSDEGVSCMHQLFEFGATPLAISYLMRISLSSVRRRFKEWQQLSSSNP